MIHDSTCRYQFVQAGSGQEALALLKNDTQPFDLGFLDWHLPDMTGLELARELKGESGIPPFPIIMITGSHPIDVSTAAMESGIQDFLSKETVDPASLPHIARNAIDRYRLMKRLVESEREAREARIRAEDASRAKSMFLSSMSHELRTPLTAVVGLADLLLENPAAADSRQMLEMIRSNGTHLAELLNDILDLAKIEAGTIDVELVECDPLLLTRELCDLMRLRAQDEGLSFELAFDTPVPARIRTDPLRLRQILMNLLTNAIKFTDKGSVRVSLCYQPEPEPCLEFTISDTGVGISEADLEVIFEPFVQVSEDYRHRKNGAGLGLSISRSLARLLGGNLTAKSRVGGGSQFSASIRAEGAGQVARYDPRLYAAPRKAAEQRPELLDGCWAGRRILIAEDTAANQYLLRRMLEATKAQTTFVETGEQAVDAVCRSIDAGRPFDVVLMDIQMPGMNGYEATRAIRREGVTGPVIALTAAAMDGDRERCLEAGCTSYLSKPINRPALLKMIADSMSQDGAN
ncbi:Autoinducer 2 sensor kinase/phosphatase LuxQ [Planctomyces sp. SH-PL14]|nr:Autoinducer 2 sensor kinase/phosphatase LuxQ [Planctomyces sp. SH-PL14]